MKHPLISHGLSMLACGLIVSAAADATGAGLQQAVALSKQTGFPLFVIASTDS
jgi:hypothetical protein